MIAGCETTRATGTVKANTKIICQAFDPIGYSFAPKGGSDIPDKFNRYDTKLTIQDIIAHNDKYDKLCK